MTSFADNCTQVALYGSTDDRPDGAEWETPQAFFDKLDEEFQFTLDACASKDNHKVDHYFTKQQDSLKQKWTGVVWCNPPYGKEIGKWLEKGRESAQGGCTVVFLIHARTDTRWFHQHVYNVADEIRFVKGRLKFTHKDGTYQSAPFPSMVVIYQPKQ